MPPTTAPDIAAWLGQELNHIEEILEWHGAASVAYVLEKLADVPADERGPEFLRRIEEIQTWREDFGFWPRTRYQAWRAHG